jgi:uncharacterized Zn finger protein (UPF0148 family)
MSIPTKVSCMKCDALYWYDGCTWCPTCDANSIVPTPANGMLPDARDRVWKMRQKRQEELEIQARAA